jgi:DNA-binding Xre family transcriptional regulator
LVLLKYFNAGYVFSCQSLMTALGLFLSKRSVNKAKIARRTGIAVNRMSQLTNKPNVKLTAEELYKIALAIEVDPCEVLRALYDELKLNS